MKKWLLIIVTILTLLPLIVFAAEKRMSPQETKARIQEMRAQEKKRLEQLRPKVRPLLNYDIELLQAALKIKVIEKYQGAVIVFYDSIMEEKKYLGKIEDQFMIDSIFNEFGTYGSGFSSDSIWNKFGTYGSEFSSKSPFNKFTITPPAIVKNNKIIGYLTVNKFIQGGVYPSCLKSFFVY